MPSRRSYPMVDLTALTLHLLRLYGPLVLCLFTFLETSMVFPFLPSEVVVPAAAALLVTDPVSLVVFVLAAGIGGTAGAFVPFYAARGTRFGNVDRITDRILVSEDRIDRGREWFRRWGRSQCSGDGFSPRSALSSRSPPASRR